MNIYEIEAQIKEKQDALIALESRIKADDEEAIRQGTMLNSSIKALQIQIDEENESKKNRKIDEENEGKKNMLIYIISIALLIFLAVVINFLFRLSC